MPSPHPDIYNRLLDLCPLHTPDPPWDFVAPQADCRRCPAPSSGILESLQEEFAPALLREAGITVAAPTGPDRLRPCLSREGEAVLVLRDRQGLPFDVVTSTGCLLAPVPLLEVWRDDWPQRAARTSGNLLFGVTCMRDVALLRGLGLAAAPIIHLDRLSLLGLKWLVALAGDDPLKSLLGVGAARRPREYFENLSTDGLISGPSRRVRRFRLRLLPDFLSSAALEIPDELRELSRHLTCAQRHCKITWSDVHVWCPSEAEFQELTYLRRLRNSRIVARFLKADRPCQGIEEFVDPASVPARPGSLGDFAAAQSELLRLLAELDSRGNYPERLSSARREYERLLEEQLIAPLIRRGLESRDPVAGNSLVALGELARLVHQESLTVQGHFSRGALSVAGADRAAPGENLKRLLMMLDRMVKLGKQIS